MLKNRLLEFLKEAIIETLHATRLDNITEQQNLVSQYFDILESITELPDLDNLNSIINNISFENIIEQRNIVDTYFEILNKVRDISASSSKKLNKLNYLSFMDNEIKETPQNTFTFERTLKGGWIAELHYPISEKTVRDLGLEHNDKVTIVDSEVFPKGGVRYQFELAKKGKNPINENRVQIDYCIVETDKELGFVVRKSIYETIRLNEVPYTFILPKKDISNFNIQENDIIDIAYYEGNISTMKVIWKHPTSTLSNSLTLESKKLNNKKQVLPEKEAKIESKESPIDLEYMEGRTIAIVGSEYNMKLRYQQAFEEYGITLIHASGDENKTRMESMLKKAEIVVFIVTGTGHGGLEFAKDICKSNSIPFIAVDRNGPQYILIEAERALKKREEVYSY